MIQITVLLAVLVYATWVSKKYIALRSVADRVIYHARTDGSMINTQEARNSILRLYKEIARD